MKKTIFLALGALVALLSLFLADARALGRRHSQTVVNTPNSSVLIQGRGRQVIVNNQGVGTAAVAAYSRGICNQAVLVPAVQTLFLPNNVIYTQPAALVQQQVYVQPQVQPQVEAVTDYVPVTRYRVVQPAATTAAPPCPSCQEPPPAIAPDQAASTAPTVGSSYCQANLAPNLVSAVSYVPVVGALGTVVTNGVIYRGVSYAGNNVFIQNGRRLLVSDGTFISNGRQVVIQNGGFGTSVVSNRRSLVVNNGVGVGGSTVVANGRQSLVVNNGAGVGGSTVVANRRSLVINNGVSVGSSTVVANRRSLVINNAVGIGGSTVINQRSGLLGRRQQTIVAGPGNTVIQRGRR